MRISDWSSDVCSSDLMQLPSTLAQMTWKRSVSIGLPGPTMRAHQPGFPVPGWSLATYWSPVSAWQISTAFDLSALSAVLIRSEEHTSELQSLMRISYAVFCLKKNINQILHKQKLEYETTC